jgi:hypothetical protein
MQGRTLSHLAHLRKELRDMQNQNQAALPYESQLIHWCKNKLLPSLQQAQLL